MTTTEATRSRANRRPPIEPRLRERRVEVTRAKGRRRRYVLFGLLAFIAVGVGGWFLAHSSLLSAKVITVSGSVHTPTNVVLTTAGLSSGPALVSVDPSAMAQNLERLPWVARATVTRQWPDGVHVTIVEHVPVAVAAGPGNTWAELDRTGRVLAVVGAAPPGLIHLTVAGNLPSPGGSLRAGAGDALLIAGSLPVAFEGQVASISETGTQVKLTLNSPLTVILGTATDLRAKYEDIAAILANASLHVGDTIDVSVPASPTVTPG